MRAENLIKIIYKHYYKFIKKILLKFSLRIIFLRQSVENKILKVENLLITGIKPLTKTTIYDRYEDI